MTCTCHIVPQDVLRRLAEDRSLPDPERKSFADTARLDVELRRMRVQANKVTQLSLAMSPVVGAIAAAPSPASSTR